MRILKGFLTAACLAWFASSATAKDLPLIGLTYIVEHPAIDAVREGIIDGLKSAGYEDGKTAKIVIRSAQGNMATQAQIANEFSGLDLDISIAISTPSAQALKNSLKGKPLIFAAVTDPVGAGLVPSMAKPGGNVTGTSDQQPYPPILELIRKLAPGARKIGVIFNPGEANSVSQVESLKVAAKASQLEIVESPAAQSALVGDAARSLVGRTDAILLPTDSTVVSVVESVVTVGKTARLPVFACDTGSVERGALAALGFNYYELGKLTAQMAGKVLKGMNPGEIPAQVPGSQDLYLNASSAKAMGVDVPAEIRAGAKKVIE
ncbi:ABC transporter substrate-binding protein [Bradyrhizobium australafricanum]|uniref:ABC transporter substrate-binding protein n=1 Tax=Bradyrhizobium australafricanum TaxID=2821406 RepID=UPI001CE3B56B|nr:ABC transporter substrate-binding protein [Bradyrhizobium australafricanum]MCA6104276.1 ABC transporter substrate-binding protein [Bradyrhizobium australafricanum]